jgi:hypothetical protein
LDGRDTETENEGALSEGILNVLYGMDAR